MFGTILSVNRDERVAVVSPFTGGSSVPLPYLVEGPGDIGPPPLTRCEYADVDGAPVLLRSLAARELLVHDDFTRVDAANGYGDTPWAEAETAGAAGASITATAGTPAFGGYNGVIDLKCIGDVDATERKCWLGKGDTNALGNVAGNLLVPIAPRALWIAARFALDISMGAASSINFALEFVSSSGPLVGIQGVLASSGTAYYTVNNNAVITAAGAPTNDQWITTEILLTARGTDVNDLNGGNVWIDGDGPYTSPDPFGAWAAPSGDFQVTASTAKAAGFPQPTVHLYLDYVHAEALSFTEQQGVPA